jgi:ABC-2 type transport system permease protein
MTDKLLKRSEFLTLLIEQVTGLVAIWEREMKIFFREYSRVISSVVTPLIWLFFFGTGIGSAMNGAGAGAMSSIKGVDYQTFIYPGVIIMSILFGSIFYGAYVVWDKKLDFLKEVLVSPLSRTMIFFGKVLGGVTDALIQATFLLLLSFFFNVHLGWNLILIYIFLFILVSGLVSIGLIIGSLMRSPEGFSLIMGFVNFPLIFLSGALFPLDNLPPWLSIITRLNPVTYGVDAIRGLMIDVHTFSYVTDFVVLMGYMIVLMVLGTIAFNKMKL